MEVRNKIGAYFNIETPLSLLLQDLTFDALDSLSAWDPSGCSASHLVSCTLDPETKEVTDADPSSNCGCASPTDHSLENCSHHLPTFFLKVETSTQESYSRPKTLNVMNCEFINFFYSLNALVEVPSSSPAVVRISGSQFFRFSTCGAIVKNVNEIFLGK